MLRSVQNLTFEIACRKKMNLKEIGMDVICWLYPKLSIFDGNVEGYSVVHDNRVLKVS